ncbi:MAG TPA: magnesium chelatase, partial [Clostridiaceae bacterium]|nr:magnesium chelatase [Clostridiaceae bacterium]
MDTLKFQEIRGKIIDNVSKVIVGKDEVIELVTVCFICGGHVLLDDIPGMGKTMLIKAFSKTLGCDFKRIQFTP